MEYHSFKHREVNFPRKRTSARHAHKNHKQCPPQRATRRSSEADRKIPRINRRDGTFERVDISHPAGASKETHGLYFSRGGDRARGRSLRSRTEVQRPTHRGVGAGAAPAGARLGRSPPRAPKAANAHRCRAQRPVDADCLKTAFKTNRVAIFLPRRALVGQTPKVAVTMLICHTNETRCLRPPLCDGSICTVCRHVGSMCEASLLRRTSLRRARRCHHVGCEHRVLCTTYEQSGCVSKGRHFPPPKKREQAEKSRASVRTCLKPLAVITHFRLITALRRQSLLARFRSGSRGVFGVCGGGS